MADLVGSELGIEPQINIENSRIGEVTHYVANIGKARALLNYTPRVPLETGIGKAVAWCTDWWARHPEMIP